MVGLQKASRVAQARCTFMLRSIEEQVEGTYFSLRIAAADIGSKSGISPSARPAADPAHTPNDGHIPGDRFFQDELSRFSSKK